MVPSLQAGQLSLVLLAGSGRLDHVEADAVQLRILLLGEVLQVASHLVLLLVPVCRELSRQQRGRLLDHGLCINVARAPKAGARVRKIRAGLLGTGGELTPTVGDPAAALLAAWLPVCPVAVEASGR